MVNKIYNFLLLTGFLFFNCENLLAQQQLINGEINYSSMLSSGKSQPFWFTHNQLGKYELAGQFYQLADIQLTGVKEFENGWVFSGGINPVVGFAEEIKGHINQLYGTVNNSWGFISFGTITEDEQLMGLSSSNGSITHTLNNRPYPKIELSTFGFQPLGFLKNKLFVRARFSEGILKGKRVVENARLHHKSLFFQVQTKSELKVTVGINHYVFWGGIHQIYGQLPKSFDDYIRYITGRKGNSDFLLTDQINVAGNQLGDYVLEIEKKIRKGTLSAYINHPFEDRSGMEFDNWRDNLIGIAYFSFNTEALIQGIVCEFLYTKHQSGANHIVDGPIEYHMRGRDNYFNHGVYSSGFTSMGMAMCSPLFYPLIKDENGISRGFENTRLVAYHLGVTGEISKTLTWKTLLTYSENFGTYSTPYTTSYKKLYSMVMINYHSTKRKSSLSLKLGFDKGDFLNHSAGIVFSYFYAI